MRSFQDFLQQRSPVFHEMDSKGFADRFSNPDDYRAYGYDFRSHGIEGPPPKSFPLEEGVVYMVFDGKLMYSTITPGQLTWREAGPSMQHGPKGPT